MRNGATLLALFLSTAAASSARAQPPAPPPPPPAYPYGAAPPPAPYGGFGTARERVRALILDRISRDLALDAATAARVAAVYDTYAERERPLRQQLRQDRRRLVALVRSGAAVDDATLNGLIEGLLGGRARLHALEDERAQAVRRVLPPAQVARLVLSLPAIRSEVRREVVRALRGRMGARGGAAPAAPAGPAAPADPVDEDDELE